MIGKTVSNFTIVEKLGEGGMGVVYRAEDARLKRPVALKFLPQHYTTSPDAVERFEREAQSAAALNHPNIITIYETGEFEGQIYIAMEYVDGVELRDLIGPGLPLPRALEIAVQVADGLHGAHEAGIVHRDIKPENILVTDKGRVKILDFGLAKLHGVTRITQESSTVGTLHYMSPEQTRGEDVDGRSDIFSFGAVLYEMITGAAAFPGDNAAAVGLAITQSTPQPLQRFNRDASVELDRIVMKCLEKSPDERYQSIKEVLVDLRKVAGISAIATPMPGTTQERPVARAASTGLGGRGAGAWTRRVVPVVVVVAAVAVWMTMRGGSPETALQQTTESQPARVAEGAPAQEATSGKKKIAVLPFQNLGNAGDEYFADGITEEITSRLAAVHDLGVISRTSAMQYKGTTKSLQEIGAELGVDYVLEGTVRWSRSGEVDRVRITPDLITVADDTHLWSDRYDRTLDDIFAVQSEIAQNIIRELDVTLLDTEQQRLEQPPTRNMEAYQAYLRGHDLWVNTQFTEDEVEQVISDLEEAVRMDPNFPAALSQLSAAHSGMVHYGYDRSEQRMAIAKGYADRCIEIAPESHYGYLALGTYYYWCRRDYDKAVAALDRSDAILPSNASTLEVRAYVKRRQGHFHEAAADLAQSLELDPRGVVPAQELGDTYICLRDYDEAVRVLQRCIEISPNNAFNYFYMATRYWAAGDLAGAAKVIASMPKDTGIYADSQFLQAYLSHDIAAAKAAMAKMTLPAATGPTLYTPHTASLARLQWALGETDAARTNFEAARTHILDALQKSPREARFYAELAVDEAALGNRAASQRARAKCLELAEPDLYGDPEYYYKFFEAKVLLDDHDAAIDELDGVLSRPSEFRHPGFAKLDPMTLPLHDIPRFNDMLARHQNETF